MAQQVRIAGVTYPDVPSISVPDASNNYHSFIDVTGTTRGASDVAEGKYFFTALGVLTLGTATGGGGGSGAVTQDQDGYLVLDDEGGGGGGGATWAWFGENPTLITNFNKQKVYLKDTGYDTWTPTTTATDIVARSSLSPTITMSSDYDYVYIAKFHSHFEYTGTVTTTAMQDLYGYYAYFFTYYPSSYSDMTTDTLSSFGGANIITFWGGFYLSNTGTQSYNTNASYGVYAGFTAPTRSGDVLTAPSPKIVARCSSTYFSTTSASAVDKENSYYELKVEVWRVNHGTNPYGAQRNAIVDMWKNGIT